MTRRRHPRLPPLLLALLSTAGIVLCLTTGIEDHAMGWTAALTIALTWLSRELDPRQ